MKKWTTPDVTELEISETAQSTHIKFSFDAIRTDPDGTQWASSPSGE